MRSFFKKKFNKTLLIVFLLFIADFLLTLYFLNTSDIADEGNPLINIAQGYPIIVINIIYFIVVIIFIFVIRKYNTILIPSKNTFEYTKGLFKNEDSSKFIYVSAMFSFVYASIISRVITITDWIVFGFTKEQFYSSLYAQIREVMPFGRFDIIISIISIFIFLPLWYKLEFNKSNNLLQSEETL